MSRVSRRPLAAAGLSAALVALSWASAARADKAACLAAYDGGQRERLAGHLVAAREATLRCAQSDCPAMLVKECTQWAGEIAAEMPSIVIGVQDAAGADVPDAAVAIDGRAVASRIDGRALPVDPGPRSVVVTRGTDRQESTIVVREREQGRVVVLRFPKRPETGTATPLPTEPPPPVREPAPVGPSRTLGWVAGGVSLAAAGAFVGFGSWARSARDDLRTSCAPYCSSDAVSSAKTKGYVADGFLALAVVAAGVSIYGFVRPGDPPRVASTTLWLTPTGASLRGHF